MLSMQAALAPAASSSHPTRVSTRAKPRLTATACLQCTSYNLITMNPDSRRHLQSSNIPFKRAENPGCQQVPKPRLSSAATHSPGKEPAPTDTEQPRTSGPDVAPDEAKGVRTQAETQAEESSTAPPNQAEDDSAPVSEYSMSSYRKFGVWRGTVLTAWRLLRCNPWGGRGYDPPAWPPKGLEAVYEQSEYAPQVTVLLGGSLLVYLVTGLVSELTS